MTHTCTLPPAFDGPRSFRCRRCAAVYQLVHVHHSHGTDEQWFRVEPPVPFLCRLRLHAWRIHSYTDGDVCARCDRKRH